MVVLTAYDAPTARLLDGAGVDIILVGDSVGNVLLGHDSTLPVTMDDMLHHLKAVLRGRERALVVADMPFNSYQASVEDAHRNAGLFLKAGADAVKLEGGEEVADTVRRMVESGIPVMGHVGLEPQRVRETGGYRAQGRDAQSALAVWKGAMASARAGAFAVVLESVPAELGRLVSRDCPVPVISCGSGGACDGQVLVFQDLVGLTDNPPKFARAYTDGQSAFRGAVEAFSRDVRGGSFPPAGGGAEIPPNELAELERMVGKAAGK